LWRSGSRGHVVEYDVWEECVCTRGTRKESGGCFTNSKVERGQVVVFWVEQLAVSKRYASRVGGSLRLGEW
jgi:hypothetical protein